MYITLEEAKKHLNIEPEYTEDDIYIKSLIQVAEQAVEVHVNDKLSHIAEMNQGELPKPLVQAMLLLIGNFYQNREVVTNIRAVALPFNFEYLINLYRNYIN